MLIKGIPYVHFQLYNHWKHYVRMWMAYSGRSAPTTAKSKVLEALELCTDLLQGNLMMETFREFCCLGSYILSNSLDQENFFREQAYLSGDCNESDLKLNTGG